MRSILLCTLMIIATGVAMLRAQDSASAPAADGFQCPVGPNGTAEGYYIARSFRSNGHLGDDWNGVKGGDTDYGDPVYTIAHGVVVFAKNYHVGWGNVVIIRHAYYEGFALRYVDSLYGHLADFTVREGQIVRRGQQIGRIGSNNGMYDAHLHFEIRKNINIGMYRSSFPRDATNYYIPNQFISAHLTCSGGNKTVSIPINTFPSTAPPSYAATKVYTPVYSPGSAPASHLPPAGVGGLRTFRTTEPPPAPKVVTAPPPTPKPAAPSAPVVETPTTASTSKKDSLDPIASKGSPIASSDKKEKDSSDKKDSKKESPPAPTSKTSKTSKTAATKPSDEPPPKESGNKEPENKEPGKKESATASTKKSATPTPSSKTSTTASTKTGSSSSAKTAATAKPTPAPSKPSATASSKPSAPPKEPTATRKPATPEPAPEKTVKTDPKPSILDANNNSLIPPLPTATESSPIRRSAPGFRVDRFQDLRGMGY